MLLPLVLVVAALGVLSFPKVQTAVGKKVTEIVSEKINGNLTFDNVYISIPNRVILDNPCITTKDNSDTMFVCDRVSVAIDGRSLLRSNEYRITSLAVKKGFFNLHTDAEGVSILNTIFGPGSEKDPDSTDFLETFCASLCKLKVEDFRFRMLDENKYVPQEGHAMNFTDLDVYDIDLDADRIKVCHDTIHANIRSLSAKEKSGFNLHSLTGDVTYGPQGVFIDEVYIEDDFSTIRSDYLKLGFTSGEDFKDFISKVVLGADFKETFLDFNTISYFAGTLEKMKLALFVNGDVNGTVTNLQSRNLDVRSWTGESIVNVGFSLIGLDEPDVAMLDVNIKKCRTNCRDVARIIASLNDEPINKSIAGLAPGVTFDFKGSLDGFFTELVAYGSLTSSLGQIDVDMMLNSTDAKNFKLIGNVSTTDFNAGRFINNDKLGEVSMYAMASAQLAQNKKNSSVRLDTLVIDKVHFNDYDYGCISGNGRLSNDEFEGLIRDDDPNLQFLFHGLLNLSPKSETANYNFDLWLGNADLHALNFDKRDTSIVSLRTNAQLQREKDGSMQGNVFIHNLILTEPGGAHRFDRIKLSFLSEERHHEVKLNSKIANANFEGTAPVTKFVTDIKDLSLNREFWNISGARSLSHTFKGEQYRLDLTTGGLEDLMSFFAPQVYIAPKTNVQLLVGENDIFILNANSDLLALNGNMVRDLTLTGNNNDDKISVSLGANALRCGNFELRNNLVGLVADDNIVSVDYRFHNNDDFTNSAHIKASVEFPDRQVSPHMLIAMLDESSFDLDGDPWVIDPAQVSVDKDLYDIRNLHIYNGQHSIYADGVVSKSPSDSVSLRVDDIDLSILNGLLANESLGLQGILNIDAAASGVLGTPIVNLDGNASGLAIFGKEIGDIDLVSEWDNEDKSFEVALVNILGETLPLKLTGSFKPDGGQLDIDTSFDKFNVDYFSSFLKSVFSQFEGGISGDVHVGGTLDNIKLACDNGLFSDLKMKIDFTNVLYTLNGPFSIDEKGVHFNSVSLRDDYNGTGTVSGGIDLGGFKDIVLNVRVNVKDALCLNNNEVQSPSFYGKCFGDGRVRITGPLNKLKLDVTATTRENTSLHVPLGGGNNKSNKLLTFINTSDTILVASVYDSLLVAHNKSKVNSSELEIKIKATATPDAEINLELNKASGDIVRARGNGIVDLTLNDAKSIFDLKGDYTITEGSYKFVLMGLASRDFTVDPGGTIRFNGDIMDSDLNLSAKYRTKASIATLIADTTSVGTRRTVDCFVNASGKLANPQLNLSMDIPDLDPTTKGRVETALNTEDKVFKQFVSLLLSGSFLPDEQSGIVNNTTLLYSNASEMLATQVNNILKQLDIPLDFGFNYQPGSNQRDMFDVAISAQLFNNRVTVNGNLGNRQYVSSGSDLAGDIDVEIKVDKNGKFRVNLFSHSADQFTNSLDMSQRNGAGIVYQQEFDTVQEFWRNLFWSREHREAYDAEQRQLRRGQMRPAQRDTTYRLTAPVDSTATVR